MSKTFDVILKGGILVDPLNRPTNIADIGILEGKIIDISCNLDPRHSKHCYDVSGLHVLPGIIDLHVHVSSWLGGKYGHKMMAQAGVTTALDMGGPVESVLDIARDYGAGLNLACLQYVRPEYTVRDADPDHLELEEFLQQSLKQGAYGLKILGGPFPLTPEATSRVIELSCKNNVYIAFHAGTLKTKSDINGFHEAVELIGGHKVTLAHINSYCRGTVKSAIAETKDAIQVLEKHPNIFSESYLSQFNGTSAKCSNGIPVNPVTAMCLIAGGYSVSQKGLKNAIQEGWAHINKESDGRMALATGTEAVTYWKLHQTDTTVSFPVNPAIPRLCLATAKNKKGNFVVDTIVTDGGGIPRNVTVEFGLSLVKLQAITIEEFARKTSLNPSYILGIRDKGHLGIGADADVTVLDIALQKPKMSLVNGNLIMQEGRVCGSGTRLVTTLFGADYVKSKGLEPLIMDSAYTRLYERADDSI